ncbi:MAG TPA: serine/threonine-protein kinase, partial [Nannocystaceae bacterium]|nr:serine/threonine-protein kinase [Nannocystaceae bacterium]
GVLAMFVQAGRGLAAAHAQGIVHRDFKPGNVVVGEDGRPRVMDFGLARGVGDALADPLPDALAHEAFDSMGGNRELGATLTADGTVVGTPPYMAPEQHAAEPVDARTDQYSYCVALWEAVYGRIAFRGRSLAELAAAKLAGAPKPPSGTDVPAALDAIIVRGLATDPADRWPDMNALLAALERVAHGGRRRRVLVIPVALGVAATAVLLANRETPCTTSAAELAQVWDETARGRVEQALLASGPSYAATTAARVLTALDERASAWTTMHRESCEATKVLHEQSDEALDLRMGCLRARRSELGAVVELLATADARVTERAIEVVGAMAPLARCADVAALRERVPPPEQASVREVVDDVRARLDQAKLEARAGRLDDALVTAEAARGDADASGYPPVVIEAEIEVASHMVALNRGADAQPLLERAFEAALAQRDLRSSATAAMVLADALQQQGIARDRTEWLLRAALGMAKGDGSDPRLVGQALFAYVAIPAGRDEEQEAERYTAAAIAQIEDAFGPDDHDLIEMLATRALLVRALGRREESAEVCERALALAERTYGPDHPAVIPPLRLIGFDAFLAGKGVDALVAFDRMAAIQDATLGPTHPDAITTQGLRAIALAEQDRLDEAVTVADATKVNLDKSMPGQHHDRASTLHNLATVYAAKGDHARAVELFREVVEIRRRFGHKTTLEPGIYMLARALENDGKVAEAETLYREAMELGAELHRDDGMYNSNAPARLAAIMRGRGQIDQARLLLEDALAPVPELDDTLDHVEARWQLGQILWELNTDRPRAVALVSRALDLLEGWPGRDVATTVAEMRTWLDTHALPVPEDPLAVARSPSP